MDKIREQIYLGALLHDIGKFWQRAAKNNYLLSQITQDIQEYLKYEHAAWTHEFFLSKKEKYNQLFSNNELNKPDNFISFGIYHHNPTSMLQAFVQMADWWASGLERSEKQDDKLSKKITGRETYKKTPLYNIFGGLNVNEDKTYNSFFKLNPISLKRQIVMPAKIDEFEQEQFKNSYEKLWNEFNNEFDKLPISTYDSHINSLFYLLKKYLWAIPASTIDLPDNSLFEHSKITASISQSLYDFYTENPDSFSFSTNRLSLNENQFPLILLCVDISGIQKFIYNIASKYAAKSLRGRSFYLEVLMETIKLHIIKETNTTLSHVVYSSGGKMFMLLPNTKFVKGKIEIIETQVANQLWDKYKGELYVCFGYQGFRFANQLSNDDALKNGNIILEGIKGRTFLSNLWQEVTKKASEKKNRRFCNMMLDVENFKNNFFEPLGKGGDTKVCSVTGNETEIIKISDEGEETNVASEVFEQKRIGEKLLAHKYLVFVGSNISDNESKFKILDLTTLSILKNLDKKTDNALIYSIIHGKENDFLESFNNGSNSLMFKFYGGSTIPEQNGKPLTFEELAGLKTENGVRSKTLNFTRLGVLRMDVDNLGNLFKNGFPKLKSGFSGFATLSNFLDLFFSGYINIIRQQEKYKDWINIIYSGGDDVFAIGRWDLIIEFANEVQQEFKHFTSRKDITISAGIELVGPKFPIAKFADMTGTAEDLAKEHIYNGQEKNSLSLFNIAINWDFEFPKVELWKNKLSDWLIKSYITKGLINLILEYYEIYSEDKKRQIQDLDKYKPNHKWKWNAAYSFARRIKSAKSDEEKAAINEIKELIFTEIYEDKFRFEAFAVACKWADLLNR